MMTDRRVPLAGARHRRHGGAARPNTGLVVTTTVVALGCVVWLQRLYEATSPYAFPSHCGTSPAAPPRLAVPVSCLAAVMAVILLVAVGHLWSATARRRRPLMLGGLAIALAVDAGLAVGQQFLVCVVLFLVEGVTLVIAASPLGDGPGRRRGLDTRLATLTLLIGLVGFGMALLSLPTVMSTYLSC